MKDGGEKQDEEMCCISVVNLILSDNYNSSSSATSTISGHRVKTTALFQSIFLKDRLFFPHSDCSKFVLFSKFQSNFLNTPISPRTPCVCVVQNPCLTLIQTFLKCFTSISNSNNNLFKILSYSNLNLNLIKHFWCNIVW